MHNKAAFGTILLTLLFCTALYPLENSTDLYNRGAELARKGDVDGAIKMFKAAVEANPYYCLAHYGLGRAYLYNKEKNDDAIWHLKKSVDLDKKFAPGYFYLGLAYLFKKKYIYAIHAFKQAYANDSDFVEALYNLGVVYDLMDKEYEAKYYYKMYYDRMQKKGDDSLF